MFFQEFETRNTLLLSKGPGNKWQRNQSSILKASTLILSPSLLVYVPKIRNHIIRFEGHLRYIREDRFLPPPPPPPRWFLQLCKDFGFRVSGSESKNNQTIPSLPLVFAIAPVEPE